MSVSASFAAPACYLLQATLLQAGQLLGRSSCSHYRSGLRLLLLLDLQLARLEDLGRLRLRSLGLGLLLVFLCC